jgi:rod shape-determining protein MreC
VDDTISRFLPAVKLYLIFIGITVVLMALSWLGWTQKVLGPAEKFVSGMYYLTGISLQRLETPFRVLTFWYDGSNRLAEMESRLARASVEKAELINSREDLTHLQQDLPLLKLKYSMSRSLPTRLVTGTNEGLISGGQSDGIKTGTWVIDGQGVLVGRIDRVGQAVSTLSRPFDQGSRIAVRVVGKTTNGILEGDGTRARLIGVLQADDLGMGDILVTSGADELYPEGIVVGDVAQLTGQASDVTKGAEVWLYAVRDDVVYVLPSDK